MRTLVYGRKPDSGNIGDEVFKELVALGEETVWDDCWDAAVGKYRIPKLNSHPIYDNLVVTLGRTAVEPFDEIRDNTIEDVIRACLTLPLLAVREFVRHAERTREESREPSAARIILVGSYAHRHPFTNGTAYCAAKAGLEMAGKTLAWELTGKGYYVNAVHPYHVEGTPMWERVQAGVMETKGMDRATADEYARKDLLLDQNITARQVARVIVDLLLMRMPDYAYLSGSSIELFGGVR